MLIVVDNYPECMRLVGGPLSLDVYLLNCKFLTKREKSVD